MTIPTLVERLRANAKFLHLAGRIGESLLENEAADEIERLRVQVRQADARGDEALRRAHKAEAAQSDPTAWYDSKSGQVDFGSWKPTRKPSAPDAEWLPFYSAPVRPVPDEPVAWVPYCFKDCSNGRAGEYRLSEVEAAPFAMVDLNSWACVPLFASPPPAHPPTRTLLEQHDLEQSADYRKGYEDGRLKGFDVGQRMAAQPPQAVTDAERAAQPKRKPLSKTQIKEAWELSCLVETTGTTATLVEHFARAIERLTLGEQP